MDHGARSVRMDRLADMNTPVRPAGRTAMLVARLAAVAVALVVGVGGAMAQTWPNRPIRLVVPFAPGGNLDIMARTIAEPMSKRLGQPVVVENRAGAGGVIGAEAVASALPDGHAIVIVSTGTLLVSPRLVAKPPYTEASFAAVGMVSVTPLLLAVPAASRFADYRAFAGHARDNPGKLSVGHAGNGTTNHIALMRLQAVANIQFTVIPYRGSGPALNDLVAGQIDSIVDQVSSSLPHVRASKSRALAVTTATRVADLPDEPTLAELGVTGFEAFTSAGLVAPAATPAAVIATLNAALNAALVDPAVVKRMVELGATPRPMSPADFAAYVKTERGDLEPLFKSGVLKPE